MWPNLIPAVAVWRALALGLMASGYKLAGVTTNTILQHNQKQMDGSCYIPHDSRSDNQLFISSRSMAFPTLSCLLHLDTGLLLMRNISHCIFLFNTTKEETQSHSLTLQVSRCLIFFLSTITNKILSFIHNSKRNFTLLPSYQDAGCHISYVRNHQHPGALFHHRYVLKYIHLH